MSKETSIDDNKLEYDNANGGVDARNIAEERPDVALVTRFGAFGGVLEKLFASGVEARGVERVPEDQRSTKNVWNNLLMWFSVNAVLTTIPIGVLAQEFYTLTLPHAIATILCFGAIGAASTAFIATLGPLTGLRTMIITRYSSGYVGGIIYSFFNILTQLGFSCICVILGGQTLASVNPGTLPLTVGVVIVGICSLIPCFVGYNLVHHYERYAWMVTFIIFIMLYALGGKAGYDLSAQKPNEDTSRDLAADVLSFGGIIFGSFSGWAPVAADYNCKLPVNTSSVKVFILTFWGLYIPICFVEILGAALMTITNPDYVNAFGDGDTGALIAQVLAPWHGFGKFILVLLALSVIANNIPNTYSAGLSIQALGRPFAAIPRFFWTFLCFAAYTIAGVIGREHFSTILSNLLSILSYWTAFFIIVTLEEHVIFRRPSGRLGGYNFNVYDTPSKLPLGVAGIVAGGFGVMGAVLGMAQVYYTGVIGKKIGLFGADLGFELSAAFSAIVFPPLRYLEIKYTGR